MTAGLWEVSAANNRVLRQWRQLAKKYPVSTRVALDYWTSDPYLPHELMVRPRGGLSQRAWGTGNNKKNYQQRGFVVSPDTTAFFIVVDDKAMVVITALTAFLANIDV
jgi:hypothetical protein